MITTELLAEYIAAGAAEIKADVALLGGTLMNVHTG